jgi:hypothetical protein
MGAEVGASGCACETRTHYALVWEIGLILKNRSKTFDHAGDVSLGADTPNADFSRGGHKLRRRRVHSDHEDRRCWVAFCYLLRGFQSIHHGHLKVQNDDIEFVVGEFRKRFATVGRFVAYFPVFLGVQQRSQAASHDGAVVDHQDAGQVRCRWGCFVHPTLMPLLAKAFKTNFTS